MSAFLRHCSSWLQLVLWVLLPSLLWKTDAFSTHKPFVTMPLLVATDGSPASRQLRPALRQQSPRHQKLPLGIDSELEAHSRRFQMLSSSTRTTRRSAVAGEGSEERFRNGSRTPPPPPNGENLISASAAAAERFAKAAPLDEIAPSAPGSKLRKLKDLMWVREALEDLTAAEFACTVEASHHKQDETVSRRRKRAVDYEKLLGQLNRRIRDLGCEPVEAPKTNDDEVTDEPVVPSGQVEPDVGAGTLVYSLKQRQALLDRLFRTRQLLLEVIQGYELEIDPMDSFTISLPSIRVEIPREEDPSSPGPKLYVRDDGTVDWDGALQDQAAMKKFGTAVWARINGRDPESLDGEQRNPQNANIGSSAVIDAEIESATGAAVVGEVREVEKPTVTAKIEETPEIIRARQRLEILTADLAKMEADYIALISSAIAPGQAVANVNLANLEPAQRSRIRESTEGIEVMKEKVSFQTLVYELERVYTYLVGEMGNPAQNGYIPLQDRLNVAEFGLLESQIDSFHRQLDEGSSSLDTDVMAVVLEQMIDFKRRLGIDYFVAGLSFDRDAIKRYMSELLEKTKKGLAFYVKGVRLFWNDIIFCLSLINRAAQGYTLKPREVRTIRRTFKDFFTFIPFVIILLIPLSPIGHVLVFGAIQRFYPDFFPSCFTEQRQNLLQLYENAEYKEFTIDENWKEKMSRMSEAAVYFGANTSRALFEKMASMVRGQSGAATDATTEKNGKEQ